MKKIRVAIINQANLICNLLSVVLEQEEGIVVVGVGHSVEEALELSNEANIILADTNLPNDGALSISMELGRKRPDVHVVITGVEKTPKTIIKYIEAGATGYILKEFTVEELVGQIKALPLGKAYADPELVAELFERICELADMCADQNALQMGLETLSPRETEVLDLLGEGQKNAEIAAALHIETGTVKNHVHSILGKLGVSNRRQAARIYEQSQTNEVST